MKNIKTIIIIFITLIYSLSINHTITAQPDDVVVIVNKEAPEINKTFFLRIFLGTIKQWPDSSNVKVLLNKDKKTYEQFCTKYLNMSAAEVDTMWMRQKIRNAVPLPRRLPDVVINLMVQNSKMFIGFVKRSNVKENVKIIEKFE